MAGDFASSSHSGQGNGSRSSAAAPLPTRYLQRLVSHLTGCLSLLSPKARQLLILRTGLSGGKPVSAPGAASALGISSAQEAALEHRAVHALRSDAGGSGCAAAQVSGATFTLGALPAGNVIVAATEHPWSNGFPGTSATGGSGAAVASAPGAHHTASSRTASASTPSSPTVIQKAAISLPGSSGSSSSWSIVALVLFGTLCGAALVVIQARRRGHSIRAAEGSSGAAEMAASAPIVSASTAATAAPIVSASTATVDEPPATSSSPWTPALEEPWTAPAAPSEWLPATKPVREPPRPQAEPPAPRTLRPSPPSAVPASGRKPGRSIFKADPLPLALLVPAAGLVARLLSHARRTRRRRH